MAPGSGPDAVTIAADLDLRGRHAGVGGAAAAAAAAAAPSVPPVAVAAAAVGAGAAGRRPSVPARCVPSPATPAEAPSSVDASPLPSVDALVAGTTPRVARRCPRATSSGRRDPHAPARDGEQHEHRARARAAADDRPLRASQLHSSPPSARRPGVAGPWRNGSPVPDPTR